MPQYVSNNLTFAVDWFFVTWTRKCPFRKRNVAGNVKICHKISIHNFFNTEMKNKEEEEEKIHLEFQYLASGYSNISIFHYVTFRRKRAEKMCNVIVLSFHPKNIFQLYSYLIWPCINRMCGRDMPARMFWHFFHYVNGFTGWSCFNAFNMEWYLSHEGTKQKRTFNKMWKR